VFHIKVVHTFPDASPVQVVLMTRTRIITVLAKDTIATASSSAPLGGHISESEIDDSAFALAGKLFIVSGHVQVLK
jgi:hypothetical protein